MSYGYSQRSHSLVARYHTETPTLDPAEVHDFLVALDQVEGGLTMEASTEPMSLPWWPLEGGAEADARASTEDPLDPALIAARRAARTASEVGPWAGRTRQRQLNRLKVLQATHRAQREAAARARRQEDTDAAEWAAWTREDRERIRAEQGAMQHRLHAEGRIGPDAAARDWAARDDLAKGVPEAPIEGRWAREPIFETRVDRSAPWGHLVMGRRCITAIDTPRCTCGVHRLTWEA